jgi:hypothetical protein
MSSATLRQLVVLGVLFSTAACQQSVSGAWTGEAAIGLSTSFGSPVGFVCVIGWDLHYQPSGAVSNLTVDARFPTAVQEQLVTTTPAGLPMTQPWPRFDDWRSSTTQGISVSTLAAMAARKHLVGAFGLPCRSHDTASAMPGSELRIRWTADGSEREQLITVQTIRQWVTSISDPNGEPGLEWRAVQ